MTADLFANVNDGDKIRVEYADGAVEGVFGRDTYGDRILVTDDELRWAFGTSARGNITAVTVLRRSLPPEPPIHTVVLDEYDHAWQREAHGWVGGGITATWGGLNAHGTARVIWTPGDDAK
jgi:hypothetical protein